MKTKELHENGMLWKHKKEIPIERIDFLKNETYVYFIIGIIILILIGFASYQAIELMQADWFSLWNTNRINAGQFRIRPSGYVLIVLIRIYPLIALYLLIVCSINNLKTLKIILPALNRYIKIDVNRILKR